MRCRCGVKALVFIDPISGGAVNGFVYPVSLDRAERLVSDSGLGRTCSTRALRPPLSYSCRPVCATKPPTFRGALKASSGRFVCISRSLFVWLMLREKYCWLVADDWFVLREKILLAG
jgi:hypothetical protein